MATKTFTELRRTGIGGTDAAAIAGLNPYVTPHDIYLDKLGLREIEENEAMYLGRMIEPFICDEYARREGVRLIRPPFTHGVMRSPTRTWMLGSPDRFVDGQEIGVDAKMTGLRQMWRWGQEGSDRVPDEYHAQAQWYLALTGYKRWDIAVLLGQSFKVYRVPPHPDLQHALISLCERFWRDHIEKRVPPPVDHTDNARKMLQALYPKEQEPLRPATDEEIELAVQLHQAERTIDATQQRRHYLLNRLRETIALSDGIAGDGFRVTWRRHKDQTVIDWESAFALATALMPEEQIGALLARCMTMKPGQRILRTYFKEDENA